MILADKIILQRKKLQMTQEELAEKMNVSRQAVSKWESAQAVPDLERILRLAELFGVTTDYLLKDSEESESFSPSPSSSDSCVRTLKMSEASDFIALRITAAKRIALGVFLCIISVIPLLALGGISEAGLFGISENFAGAAGLTFLFICAAVAVLLFVFTGTVNEPWEFLEKEDFELEYGVDGMVRSKRAEFKEKYSLFNLLGILLCVISPLPVIIGAFGENELLQVMLLCLMFLIVAAGAVPLVYAGVRRASFDKILREGDFKRPEKKKSAKYYAVQSIYWSVVTAAYLAWSFISSDWHITWVIWPVAGVLSPVIDGVFDLLEKKDI